MNFCFNSNDPSLPPTTTTKPVSDTYYAALSPVSPDSSAASPMEVELVSPEAQVLKPQPTGDYREALNSSHSNCSEQSKGSLGSTDQSKSNPQPTKIALATSSFKPDSSAKNVRMPRIANAYSLSDSSRANSISDLSSDELIGKSVFE